MLNAGLNGGEPGLAMDWTTDVLLTQGAYALVAMVLVLVLPWVMRSWGGHTEHWLPGAITVLGSLAGGVYLLVLAGDLMRHTPGEALARVACIFLLFAAAEWINIAILAGRDAPWWFVLALPALFAYGIVVTWSETATNRQAAALGISPELLNLGWVVLAVGLASAFVLRPARR